MNKKTIILISMLGLVVLAYFLLNRNIGKTMGGKEMEFEFAKTDKIDKIFISNKKTSNYILLEKKDDKSWSLNKDFKANIYRIDLIMETLRKVRVKRPIAKNEREHVVKDFALNGTKVEIYENGALSKVFYVGRNTPDEMGTYYYMDGAEEPYVCHIPGFNGYLNARFPTKLNDWKSKTIFSLKDEEIKSIQLDWKGYPGRSFTINNENNSPVLSSNGKVFENNTQVNLNKLKSYMKLWENLSFEGIPEHVDAHEIDSIGRTQPMLVITVIDKKDQASTLAIHLKGLKGDERVKEDLDGNPLDFDIESFYAFINGNKKEIVQIQDYIFGKVMKSTPDFLLQPNR